MFKNCQQCCPQKVVENYNTLKEDLSKDFIKHLNKWFNEHPYVKKIYLSDCRSIFSNNYLFINKINLENIKSKVTFE